MMVMWLGVIVSARSYSPVIRSPGPDDVTAPIVFTILSDMLYVSPISLALRIHSS